MLDTVFQRLWRAPRTCLTHLVPFSSWLDEDKVSSIGNNDLFVLLLLGHADTHNRGARSMTSENGRSQT